MFRKMNEKDRKRLKRKIHIRKSLSGTPARPRLTVTRSNKNFSAQLVDDVNARTFVSISTLEKDYRALKPTVAGAGELGEAFGKRILEKNIKEVVFDRNGYLYHGVVKAFADGARKAGVAF